MPKRVYLPQISLVKKAGIHTAYTAGHADGTPVMHPGDSTAQLYKIQYIGGVARDVDERTFQRLRDAGAATTEKPHIPGPFDEPEGTA